ncbi:MAG: hypothetical protein AAGF94_14630 [Pseudomonadota bacterium]
MSAAVLRGRHWVVGVFIALAGMIGAAPSSAITYNGHQVHDLVDNSFVSVEVGDDGKFERIYRNMTGTVIDQLRFVFLPPLSEQPTTLGGNVSKLSLDEVIYTNLGLENERLFRLRLSGLVPKSIFAVAPNNIGFLSPKEIQEMFNSFNAPAPAGSRAVPLPMPIALLGSGLVLLGATRGWGRWRQGFAA